MMDDLIVNDQTRTIRAITEYSGQKKAPYVPNLFTDTKQTKGSSRYEVKALKYKNVAKK